MAGAAERASKRGDRPPAALPPQPVNASTHDHRGGFGQACPSFTMTHTHDTMYSSSSTEIQHCAEAVQLQTAGRRFRPTFLDGQPPALGAHARLCSAQCATWHSRLQADSRRRARRREGLVMLPDVAAHSPSPPQHTTHHSPGTSSSSTHSPGQPTCSTRCAGSGCTCAGPAPPCRSQSRPRRRQAGPRRAHRPRPSDRRLGSVGRPAT